MQPSMFNVRVPLEDQNEVFLMNTFTDAQLIVSSDVATLLDELERRGTSGWTSEEREAIGTLAENGFIVESRDADRDNPPKSVSLRSQRVVHMAVLLPGGFFIYPGRAAKTKPGQDAGRPTKGSAPVCA